jgi:hypothetical protein
MTKATKILAFFLIKLQQYPLVLTKKTKEFGQNFGHFFTNASGHPGQNANSLPKRKKRGM